MKLNFTWNNDGSFHQYCAHCHAETVTRVYEDDKTYYFCSSCKLRQERSIIIDPATKWWIGDDHEYWHESAGVFVRNLAGKFLFFERTIFPFALTVPSGHVDAGEDPQDSAPRELEEEVGIKVDRLTKIATEDIVGDSCCLGADAHRWHAYLLQLKSDVEIEVREEGGNPVWLSLEEARTRSLTFPVEYMANAFARELVA